MIIKIIKKLFNIRAIILNLRNKSNLIAANSKKLDALLMGQMIAFQHNPNALFALASCLPTKPRFSKNAKNIARYLDLVRPFTAPSLKLARIGGEGDGGYCMLPPPPRDNSVLSDISGRLDFHSCNRQKFYPDRSKPFNPEISSQSLELSKQDSCDKISINSTQDSIKQSQHTAQNPNNQLKPKALSLGVSSYSPWDLEMANMGYEVLEFDASIEQSPYPKHPNIRFVKKFIGTTNSDNTISLESIISEYKFNKNAHNIMQCDIENAEWDILEHIDIGLIAQYFSQVIFEFHECDPDNEEASQRRFKILESIRAFYSPIWTHFNHYGGMIIGEGLIFCPTIEVAYIRNDLLPKDAVAHKGYFRLGIDSSNSLTLPDIPLVFK